MSLINSEILDKKYVVKDRNGNSIVDLTRSTYIPVHNVPIRRIVVVTADYEGRPDLIAQNALGDASKFDYILKFNGISNPFSIKKGDYIFIPDDESFKSNIKSPVYISSPKDDMPLEEFILQPNKADEGRLEALKEIAENSTILPPNINADGERNVVITDDKIILGASTTEGVVCEDTIPRKRLKEMLKNNGK